MADHDNHGGAFFFSSAHGHNILIFFGIMNYSIGATKIRFSLKKLQVVRFIDTDLPQIANGNFSAANVKLTGQALSLITSKMGDVAMDLADSTDTVNKLWLRLHSQYHEKR